MLQIKVPIAALDPLGLPLVTTVVAGNTADDPLYVPVIAQVQRSLGRGGRLYVGDCKMAAWDTRAFVAATDDHYLCPLSAVQVPAAELERLLEPVWDGGRTLTAVLRPALDPTEPPRELEGAMAGRVLDGTCPAARGGVGATGGAGGRGAGGVE